ncbi:MAG: tetratricopeptide repeat protein [Bacteroidota bacterium]
MKEIKIFLASSEELKTDRDAFERAIAEKSNLWSKHKVRFAPIMWENLSSRMSETRSQDEINEKIKESDLFVVLAYSKIGMYTDEEFETAFGAFQKNKKPFIFTYFKDINTNAENSLQKFKDKLNSLGHFYSRYSDFNHLWNQFNQELDRLLIANFEVNDVKKNQGQSESNQNLEINNSGIQNVTINYGDVKIPKALGGIPARPSVYIGRKNSTENIHKILSSNDHLLLLVNGQGGIGKTTMASQYYFDYLDYYKHLIWLVSESGIEEAILSIALSLRIRFQDNSSREQKIDEVVRRIAGLNKPVLLVIDNANDLSNLRASELLLRKFHNIHILLTSRIDNYPNFEVYPVKHLDKVSANKLFKKHFPRFKAEEQDLLDQLLVAVGYNTLVIELLAKNLSEFNNALHDNYPLISLLEDIQQKGLLAISKSAKVSADYKMEHARPEDIIKAMYNISALAEDEKHILAIFALLPATSISYEYMKKFLPEMDELDRKLLKASQKGWIEFDSENRSFKTNPIISEIIRIQSKAELEEMIESLFNYFVDRLDYQPSVGHIEGDFNEIQQIVRLTETAIKHYDAVNFNKSIVLERLGNFYKTYGDLEKALGYFEEDLKLMQELHESHPSRTDFKNGLAISYAKLGETQSSLGNLEKALGYFEEYLKLMKELHESHPSHADFKNGLAISYTKLGETQSSLGNLEKALGYFEEYLKLMKELHESHLSHVDFKNGLAISHERLGSTHRSLGNLEKALDYFEEYLRLEKKLHEMYPENLDFKNGLAISYEKLGVTHSSLGHLKKALGYFEEEIVLFKELYERHPSNVRFKNGLAISFSKLGSLMFDKLNRKEEGKEYLIKCREIWKEMTEQYPMYQEFQNNYEWAVNKLKAINNE